MTSCAPCANALVLAAALAAAGCAMAPPRMAQPEALRRGVEIAPIRGAWSGDSGYVAVAGHVGGFSRGPKALTDIGLVDLRTASAAFDLIGPELPGAIDAVCDADDAALRGDSAAEEGSGLTCDFGLDGLQVDWTLELGAAADDARARQGVIALDGGTLAIASTARTQAGGLAPFFTGYVFSGEAGVVASVDLTADPPALRVATGTPPALRRAALVGAVALAVLSGPRAEGG
jgi:hypothetical protein